METLTLNVGGRPARRVVEGGRAYLVSNIVMLVPGVLPGSRGPLMYPGDEVARSARSWNGVPLTLRHPTANDGRPVTARWPGVLDRFGMGEVRNVRVRPLDGALVGEAWFDEGRVKTDRWLHNALTTGTPVEVSTGLFTDNSPAPPNSRCPRSGRGYDLVARNYRPDHMAILPEQAGACSLRDGCGLNLNARTEPAKAPARRFPPALRVVARPLVANAEGRDAFGQFAGGAPGPNQPPAPMTAAGGMPGGNKPVPKRPAAAAGSAEAASRIAEARDRMPDVRNAAPHERLDALFNAIGKVETPGLSSEKACQIMRDGEVRGHPLTKAQRGLFGMKCGETRNALTGPSGRQLRPATEGSVGRVSLRAVSDPLGAMGEVV